MKMVGYLQLKNELQQGNLERVLTNMSFILDKDNFVIYDDGSDDGSQEIYAEYTSHIIQGKGGEFQNELYIKQMLFEYCRDILKGDWIVWQDGDTVFDRNGTDNGGIVELIKRGEVEGITGWGTHWINTYLHPRWCRLDQQYNAFGQMNIYKIEAGIEIDVKPGLHQKQTPNASNFSDQDSVEIIHLGFSSPQALEDKYILYYECGQRHWALERIISMSDMKLELIPESKMPKHFCPDPGSCPVAINFEYLRRQMPPFGLDEMWVIDQYRTKDMS